MPSDWSDPDRAERELARREGREPSGGDAAADQQGFAEAVLAMRRLLERIEAETSSQTEDIAGLRDMLAADRPSLPTPRENAPGTELAEAEGRLTAHVDRLGDSIEHTVRTWPAVREMAMTASAVPAELGKLSEAVNKQDERQGKLTDAISDHTHRLIRMEGRASWNLEATKTGMAARFESEAQSVRNVLQQTADTVLERRRRSKRDRWFIAGAILLGVLACIAAGGWLQWALEPIPPQDTAGSSSMSPGAGTDTPA